MNTRFRQFVILLACLCTAVLAHADPALTITWSPPAMGTGHGTITLTINGSYSRAVPYGQFSSAASIAANFGGLLSLDPHSPVWAKGQTDGTVLMKARSSAVTSLTICYSPNGTSGCTGAAPSGTNIATNVGNVASSSGPGPHISGLSISHGKLGQSVTINGMNFGTSTTNSPQTLVTLDGSPVRFSLLSTTAISVAIRNGDASGNFVVNVGSASSNGVYFTIDAPDLCVVYPSFPTN